MAVWGLRPGDITTRTEVSVEYGGAKFGGIQPSRLTPNVMIYTDPAEGEQHGYVFDGWDAEEADVFYYSGEGQAGDQAITKGNKAIAQHIEDGRALRVFEAASGDLPGGKLQRYVGEFQVDPVDPYRFEWVEDVSDRRGRRRVVVFRLLPLGGDSREVSRAQTAKVRHSGPHLVAPEDNAVDAYDVAPATGDVASRREADIMRRFEAALIAKGHKVGRVRIPVPGTQASMVTDTFVTTTRTLWEIKSSADRATIRLALGQLADYLRFTDSLQCRESGLVLPDHPGEDLAELIYGAGHRLVVDRGENFIEYLQPPNSGTFVARRYPQTPAGL